MAIVLPIDSLYPTSDLPSKDGTAPLSDSIVEKALKRIKTSQKGIEAQRAHARSNRRFRSGHHLEDADLSYLRDNLFSHAAFNVTQKFLRYVAGLERQLNEQISFVPNEVSETSKALASDFIQKCYHWLMNKCHGNDEISQVFEDKICDGLGSMETYLDTSIDPAGRILKKRRDIMDLLWDTNSREMNLGDKEWVGSINLVPDDEALLRYPDREDIIRSYMVSGSQGSGGGGSDLYSWAMGMGRWEQYGGSPQQAKTGREMAKGMVPIIDYEWKEWRKGFYFYDPLEKEATWLSDKDFTKYKENLLRLKLGEIEDEVYQLKPRFRRISFLGRHRLIDPVDLPGPRFTYNFMTGLWDDEEKVWAGFITLFKDPQRFANLFLNQALEVIKKQAKGGIFAEKGAFVNQRKAEQEYARAGSITMLNDDKIQKIKEKQLPQLPSGSIQMLQFCIDMFQEVGGISAEAVGTADGPTPTGTHSGRNKAGIILMGTEFASLKRFKEDEAYIGVDFFPLIADGRLIRVGGPLTPEIIQLTRDPFLMSYDIVIEESESDPSLRQRYLEAMMPVLPMLIKSGKFVPEILDYFPWPRMVIEKLKQAIQQQEQMAQQMRAQGMDPSGRGKQDPPEIKKAKAQKLDAETALILTKARMMAAGQKNREFDQMLKVMIANEEAKVRGDQAQREESKDHFGMGLDLLGHMTNAFKEEKPPAPGGKK